ncbi:hypothetical protein Gpo141_00000908 [Globisporangium polare]
MKSYDEICTDATTAAELRLLEHFKLHGGEVWTIGSGCQSCRQKLDDTSALKKCVNCHAALFCDRECQVKGWKAHKPEIASLLNTLTWSAAAKNCSESKVVGVAKSLSMDEKTLPGWFFSLDYELESAENQKALYQAALDLCSLLRDEECWTRDKESFPRSSYTNIELVHTLPNSKEIREAFFARSGHLVLFSAWLQHPEPPATQTVPLEDRGFYGVIDSILQISSVRDGIDAFMDSRSA